MNLIGRAEALLRRLTGCLDRGLDLVREVQATIRQQVVDIAVVEATRSSRRREIVSSGVPSSRRCGIASRPTTTRFGSTSPR